MYPHLCGLTTSLPHPSGFPTGDLKAQMRWTIDNVLATQEGDGSYLYMNGAAAPFNKPFMVALWDFTLGQYYDFVESDPRILDSVKRSADYMWANQWDASKLSFWYPGPIGGGGGQPAPDLNGLMVAIWGWLYAKTGDEGYKAAGADMIKGAVKGAYLGGQKQFNQTYLESYQYFAYAKGAA
jgi:hypothetical protein